MTELKYRVAEYRTTYHKRETLAVKITCSNDLADFARSVWPEDLYVKEVFMLFTMNQANNIFGYEVISSGTLVGTVVDIKKIGKSILDTMASSIIVVHNHPSQTISPSDADITMTEKIKSVANMVDTRLVDHVIIGEKGHFSFADEGLI
jgi:DNA repair protein RadC